MMTLTDSVSGDLCILRLNAPPVNAITLQMLDDLRAAIRRANGDSRIRGIVIAGRPGHFSAGADVGLFRDIARPDEARLISRRFQETFRDVEDSAKPVAAAVAGPVTGSALELSMACHVRICGRGSSFSMPEVNLGVNPGAGGTQRLPRLVGVEAALKMLLSGEPLNASEALSLGLTDAVVDGDDLIARAADRLRSAAPRKTRDRREKIADAAANEAAFARARQRLAGVRPEILAPSLILEAVRVGLSESFEAGLRKEQEAFAQCMDTPAARNKIYVFFAIRETAKTTDAAPAEAIPIARVAVIGMGSMGTGIVQAVLMAGLPVVVRDENPSALETGRERIRGSIQKRVDQGRLSPDALAAAMGRLSTTTDWPAVAGSDLVIEAVDEDAAVKRSVLRAAEEACPDAALFASNTSTLSLDALAEGLRRPQRLIGLHFFYPAHHMPLVEVIRREATPPEVVSTALRFAKTLRKTPVLVRNREGFLVNRIFVPYLNEAFRLLQDGADADGIDQAMVAFGFPMGPLTLIDMAGIDILARAGAVLSRAFPRHGPIPPIATALVAAGRVGQKAGAGIYRYDPGDHTPRPCAEARAIIARAREQAGRPPQAIGADEITRRLVLRMVVEAFDVLDEGLVLRESDVDAALVLGVGFPDFRGGVLKYARDRGLPAVLRELESLADRWGERFAPGALLRKKGAS